MSVKRVYRMGQARDRNKTNEKRDGSLRRRRGEKDDW